MFVSVFSGESGGLQLVHACHRAKPWDYVSVFSGESGGLQLNSLNISLPGILLFQYSLANLGGFNRSTFIIISYLFWPCLPLFALGGILESPFGGKCAVLSVVKVPFSQIVFCVKRREVCGTVCFFDFMRVVPPFLPRMVSVYTKFVCLCKFAVIFWVFR